MGIPDNNAKANYSNTPTFPLDLFYCDENGANCKERQLGRALAAHFVPDSFKLQDGA